MKSKVLLCVILSLISVYTEAQESPRKIIELDKDWRFCLGNIEEAQSQKYDDSAWQKVDVPHDWAINAPFDMNLDAQRVQVLEDGDTQPQLRTGRTGALPFYGVGWYRRVMHVAENERGSRFFIEFDGAMSRAKVYLNGNYIGEWPYGYSSFSFDVTDNIIYGADNILAVRLENTPESSRWYSGAGLYRNVRWVVTHPIYVKQWGTYITTPSITKNSGEVVLKTEIAVPASYREKVRLVTDIVSPQGKVVATAQQQRTGEEISFIQKIRVSKPLLWSIESPHLYTAVTKLYLGKELCDTYSTTFGFRTIRFDKEKGFFLNNVPIKIKGVCLHHDLGPLGAAVNHRATRRQLEIMKEMGCNAIRTSHNPPSPEQLALCDSMGFVVMVESFDEWRCGKNENGYNLFFDQWAERDMVNMIRRDRNHPSVIIWSIGNEIREQEMADGRQTAKFLAGICRREDPTRPVTAGFDRYDKAIRNGLTEEVDLVGFNYKPFAYEKTKESYPDYILYGSETASTVSSRGEYKFPVSETKSPWYSDYQVSSYDLECTGWASTPETEFEKQDDLPYILGEFVWTGFDYLGEPSPYNEGTPARSSYFGIVDLAGLKKDRFYLYQSKWSDKPMLHLLPHWTWPDRLGQKVPVFCYTNYAQAELFVNGVSMGIRKKSKDNKYSRYRLMWDDVVYSPGQITVVAMDDKGQPQDSSTVKTAGEPFQIKMTPDRDKIVSDGKDLSFITVEVLDKAGNPCPRSNSLLFFEVRGAGQLKAVCNGDATDQTSFSSNYMRLYNGKLVVVVASTPEQGAIEVVAYGSKLKEGHLRLISSKK